ncbi:hypothetical protein J3F83DRAFT_705060 [Trichoderma novae-zelandiae]
MNRKHRRPSHLCEQCFADFKDDASLQRHIESQCAAISDTPYLSQDQQKQLDRLRISEGWRGRPEAEKWEQMYCVIFPGEDVPSPYKNELYCNEHVTRLRSAIECIFDALDANEDLVRAFHRIVDVTRRAIRAVSGTAGGDQDDYAQGGDMVDGGLDTCSPTTVTPLHNTAAPTDYSLHPGDSFLGPNGVASPSAPLDPQGAYVGDARTFMESLFPDMTGNVDLRYDAWAFNGLEGAPDTAGTWMYHHRSG